MKLCVCGMAMASSLLWGGSFFVIGLVNRAVPGYGWWYLKALESLYPGYHAGLGLKNLAIGLVYGLVDGAIFGALLAWIYSKVSSHGCCGSKNEDQKKCCS